MRFAKTVFLLAGASGVLLVAPAYFLEGWAGEFDPPPINHREYYYGLVGAVLVWQFAYLLIASDPIRFRPVMLLGATGKASVALAVGVLYLVGPVPPAPLWLGLSSMDAVLALLFVVAYRWTPGGQSPSIG
jgi:hypothetical protein